MKYHTFLFALGMLLFAIGVCFATFRLERGQNRSPSKWQPIIYLFIPFGGLLAAYFGLESSGASRNISTISVLIALCGFGSWSVYQVIYALVSGKARRFSHHVVSSPGDSGYCIRAVEPAWFWYHISIYALQGGVLLVLFVLFMR